MHDKPCVHSGLKLGTVWKGLLCHWSHRNKTEVYALWLSWEKNLWHCISQSQYFFKEKVCVCARTCVFVCLCDFAIHIVWHSSIILNRVSLALSLQYSVIPLHFSDGGFVKLLWTEVLYLSIGPTTVAQQCATPIFSVGRLIEQQLSFISLWLTWSILHWMTMHYHIHSHSWGIHWYHFTLLSSTKPDI